MTASSSTGSRVAAYRGAGLLTLLFLASAGWNIWNQGIAEPDEPRYACPGRDFAEGSGDWSVPEFNGVPRLKKPLLIYWLLGIAGKVGNALNLSYVTAFRCVPLCFGLLAVLSVYGWARRTFGERVGLLAGLLLASTFYFHDVSRQILIDPILTGLVALSWYLLVRNLERFRDPEAAQSIPLQAAFYACLGLVCAAKGPALVLAFDLAPMLALLLWAHEDCLPRGLGFGGSLRRAGFFWGLPLALGVGFSWCALMVYAGHAQALWAIFEHESLRRAMGRVDHNDGIKIVPFAFYLYDLPGKFLPWSLFWIPALIGGWSLRKRLTLEAKLLLCAIVVPFLLLGLAGSKRSLYLLPLYPALALWTAWGWQTFFLEARTSWIGAFWRFGLYLIAALAALAGVSAVAFAVLPDLQGLPDAVAAWRPGSFSGALALAAVGTGLLACGWGFHRYLGQGDPWRAGICSLVTVTLFLAGHEIAIRPVLERRGDATALYAELERLAKDRPIAWFGGRHAEAVWHLRKKIQRAYRVETLKENFFEWPGALLVTRPQELKKNPDLRASLLEQARLAVAGETKILAIANPAHPPPASLFGSPASAKGRPEQALDEEEEE